MFRRNVRENVYLILILPVECVRVGRLACVSPCNTTLSYGREEIGLPEIDTQPHISNEGYPLELIFSNYSPLKGSDYFIYPLL
jgi:hypothetical protein